MNYNRIYGQGEWEHPQTGFVRYSQAYGPTGVPYDPPPPKYVEQPYPLPQTTAHWPYNQHGHGYAGRPEEHEFSIRPNFGSLDPSLVESKASPQPLLASPGSGVEYPTYIGLSAPGRKPLTWRPWSMRWPYLFTHIFLLAAVTFALFGLMARSYLRAGFSEDRFPVNSLPTSALFRITPAAVAFGLKVTWAAIDQDFRRITPFIDMANPFPARRRCWGRRNAEAGARGKHSLLLDYFPYIHYLKDYYMGCRGHWAVATSTGVVATLYGVLALQSALFSPQRFSLQVPANGSLGLQFQSMANWQQGLNDAYTTTLGKELAISELGLALNVSVAPSRKYRAWREPRWSVLPYVLVNMTGSLETYPTYPSQWVADTVVFHGGLECDPASSQNEVLNGNLIASFRDSAGCSAQQIYPLPTAGQYLSFWNVSGGNGADGACRSRQLVAWGKASSPSTVDWTTISCSPRYRTATTRVLVGSDGLSLPSAKDETLYTTNITQSVFSNIASDFLSPGTTEFINHVFFESGLASAGQYPDTQASFFRGFPQLTFDSNFEDLLEPSHLAAVAQNSFERIASRTFAIGLSIISSAEVNSHPMAIAPNGILYTQVYRWGVNVPIAILILACLLIALCGALGLLLSVTLKKKYRVTGLKYDITTTAGLMLLLHRSGRVLDEDFKDLDQSTKASDLTKRLGDKLYRLGYWQDARGAFWGISREAGNRGIAKWRVHNQIPRVPPEKLRWFRYRQGRPEIHIAFATTVLGLTTGLLGLYLVLAFKSGTRQGLHPILPSDSWFRLALLWSSLPTWVTIYVFTIWWGMVDMYFRSTQPFVDLNTPRPANENIATDYRTLPSLWLPLIAAYRRRWKLFLVSCVSLLTPVMVALAGALFIYDILDMNMSAWFVHTYSWKTGDFATPKLEPYLYQSASTLRGSGAWSSWADATGLYLPLEPVNFTVPPINLTTPMWEVDTQRVKANLTNCSYLEIGTDITVTSSRIQFGGQNGEVFDSVSLEKGKCPSGAKITFPCGQGNSNSTGMIPDGVCSSWKLLPSETGKCDYDGWWWIYWQSGKGLGYNDAGQPVFALDPAPVFTSLLCDTAIWLSEGTLLTDLKYKWPWNFTTKRTVRLDNDTSATQSGKSYKNTFNSLLSDALNRTRTASDSRDLMAVLMEGLNQNRTNLSSPYPFQKAASVSYSNIFSIYTRNEYILWSPLNNDETQRATMGTISWKSLRILVKPHSVGFSSFGLLLLISTALAIGPSLRERRLPRWVSSMADTITYFYRSRVILEDFYGLDGDDVPNEKVLARRLMEKNRRYVFGIGTGRDGVRFMGIGEESQQMEYEEVERTNKSGYSKL